jgi:hypothetical protein
MYEDYGHGYESEDSLFVRIVLEPLGHFGHATLH